MYTALALRLRQAWAVLLVLVVVVLVSVQPSQADLETSQSSQFRGRGQVTVNGMVAMFGHPDWKLGFDGQAGVSKCTQQVTRIAQRLGVARRSNIKFAPYFFYEWNLPGDKASGEDKNFRHNVTKWLVRDSSYLQVEPTVEELQAYTADLAKCIQYAISLGFGRIYVNPMIDHDYNYKTADGDCCPWRNAAEYDPTKLLGGDNGLAWSFETLVVQPTVAAIKRAVQASRRNVLIMFGLGGENGRSFTKFGAKWATVATNAQAGLGRIGRQPAVVGPNFDFAKLCGTYCKDYSESTKITADEWTAFKQFLQTSNMFGVSSYPNVWDQYQPASKSLDVQQAVRLLDAQLQEFAGVTMRKLRESGKIFILNEIGLGGCEQYGCNGTTTPDIYQLAARPFNGQPSFDNYGGSPIQDPFRYHWTKAFRMEWWRQQLAFYKTFNNPFSPDSVFLWGIGSWSIIANYHPDSLGQKPDDVGCDPTKAYCDPELLAMLGAFNRNGVVPFGPYFNLPAQQYYVKPASILAKRAVVAQVTSCAGVRPELQPLVCSRPVYDF